LWAVYRDLPRTASDGEFDQLAAPLFAPQIHFDAHTFERIATCFAVRGVSASRRAKLILRLLSLQPADLSKFDPTGVPDFTVLPRGVPELFTAAAIVFARANPSEMDTLLDDGELRRKVAELAVRSLGDRDYDEGLYLLHPVFVTLLHRGDAKPILAKWIQDVAETAARKDGDLYYITNIAIARMLALAELAPGVGLDVAPLFDAVLASPQPSPAAIYTHAVLVRGAVIARETNSRMAARQATGKQAP